MDPPVMLGSWGPARKPPVDQPDFPPDRELIMTKTINHAAEPAKANPASIPSKASTVADLSGGSTPSYEDRFKGSVKADHHGSSGRWARTVDDFVRPCNDCGNPVIPGVLRATTYRKDQPKFCPECRKTHLGNPKRSWVSPSPMHDPPHLVRALNQPSKWAHLHRKNWPNERTKNRKPVGGCIAIELLPLTSEWDEDFAK